MCDCQGLLSFRPLKNNLQHLSDSSTSLLPRTYNTMSQTDLLTSIRVASPCHVSWDNMTGDDRIRFCTACNLNVYNFAEMTGDEVRSMISNSNGRVCGRLYRRTDGTLITKDCPVGLRALRRRVRRFVGAVFATVLSLGSLAFAQSGKKDIKGCSQTAVNLERTKDKGQIGDFTGFVVDPNGAFVSGASVTLINDGDKRERTTTTNDNGVFTFSGVSNGAYTLKIAAAGFKTFTLSKVQLSSDELTRAGIHLALGDVTTLIGVVAASPELEYTNGTMIIRGDAIRKLPIP